MRVGARLLRLLLAALALLLCCACNGGDEVRELTEWTLVTPAGARRAVTLPVRFTADDIGADSHVALETAVPLPGAWRDGPVTLGLPVFVGDAALRANGRSVSPTCVGASYAWSLPPDPARPPILELALDLDTRAAAELASTPRLSPTETGDRLFLRARDFNFLTAVVSLSIGGFLGLLYALLFLLDRSRREHGWFVVQAWTVVPIAGLHARLLLGLSSWLFPFLTVGALVGVVAAEGFARAYFRHPPLRSTWLWGLLVVAAANALTRGPALRDAVPMATALLGSALAARQVVSQVRELRSGRDRFPAALLAAGWVVVIASFVPDQLNLAALPDVTGGFRTACLGIVVYAMCQVVILGRDHIRSLREAAARVRELEEQRREVDELNEELRRQVAERSRELTEALARSEGNVAPAELDVGAVFDGRYRVTRALGRGGMGAVYEVERTRDARRFALKVVTRELSGRAAARFAREAEIGARVRHENLVSIVDVGIAAGGTPFLVMELVEGGSLEEQRARFGDPKWALPVLRQIAAGLAELHASRIVHRDLKPGNVLLLPGDGAAAPVAKISDFGISRFGALDDSADVDAEATTAAAASANDARPRDLTQTGALMGTPLYMPPEALLGPARHPSADVFSFGILAYEALTGRAPFAVAPVLLRRARQPIPQPAPLEGVGTAVAALVLACLRVEPTERPRARELADALRPAATANRMPGGGLQA